MSSNGGRLIAPSLLAVDLTRLREQVDQAERAGADRFHIDVMDGLFVPNITMGPQFVEAVRQLTPLPLEVHLMVERPERFVAPMAQAGADWIQIQVESTRQLHRTVASISDAGCQPAVVLSPATPIETLTEIVSYVGLVNLMTVEPGFGGQKFIPTAPDKIRRVREMWPEVDIEVDGGVDAGTARTAVQAGANVFVSGTFVFKSRLGVEAAVAALRSAVD